MPINLLTDWDDEGDDDNELVPDVLIDQLDMTQAWLMQLLANNGSDEIDDDGSPMFKTYRNSTLASIAMGFAYTRLLRAVLVNLFFLHQGDMTEEQFHHQLAKDIEATQIPLSHD